MISIRQIHKNLINLWYNRVSVLTIIKVLLNDKVEPSSIKTVRRRVARGHSISAKTGRPLDAKNEPIRWYTYPLRAV